MSDCKIVEKVLRTLSDKFTYVVISIEESKDTEKISIDELQGILVMHEKKFNRTRLEEEEQVLKVEEKYDASRSRGRGHGRGRGRGRSSYKDSVECYRCHNFSHYRIECPQASKEANYVETEEEFDELLLMAYTDLKQMSKPRVQHT